MGASALWGLVLLYLCAFCLSSRRAFLPFASHSLNERAVFSRFCVILCSRARLCVLACASAPVRVACVSRACPCVHACACVRVRVHAYAGGEFKGEDWVGVAADNLEVKSDVLARALLVRELRIRGQNATVVPLKKDAAEAQRNAVAKFIYGTARHAGAGRRGAALHCTAASLG